MYKGTVTVLSMRRHELAGYHMIPSEPRPLITDNSAFKDLACPPIWRTFHLLRISAGQPPLRPATIAWPPIRP